MSFFVDLFSNHFFPILFVAICAAFMFLIYHANKSQSLGFVVLLVGTFLTVIFMIFSGDNAALIPPALVALLCCVILLVGVTLLAIGGFSKRRAKGDHERPH